MFQFEDTTFCSFVIMSSLEWNANHFILANGICFADNVLSFALINNFWKGFLFYVFFFTKLDNIHFSSLNRECHGRDRMVVGFTTTCATSTYLHWCCEFEPRSWRGVLDTKLCDKVGQWLAAGRCYSPCTPVSSTNKTDRHDITEILLKVALNTIKQTNKQTNNIFII